jgi:hypothetical protein
MSIAAAAVSKPTIDTTGAILPRISAATIYVWLSPALRF